MVRAAGIAAGTLFIAIALAAQFGGADIFRAPAHIRPVSQLPRPSVEASPSPQASPSPSASPVNLAVTVDGTIFSNFGGRDNGGGHKKHKG